ncbi:hypothetical protein [Candidatus Fokinia crypta]|uniref:Uncharacterized protein n=1 Tax=Candidatus Fokinia crypta TaxID=1920990 RepID=A0ABZ0UNE5_9RICK|nr:hypothetical protein [Candidatus Fokinia cryptica]WPX97641.1 hypothetical protein Fokcrypt_00150 [Candidatus Fokinia cryptica]
MKKYLALALVGSLVMGNASASQTLNALDAASPVLTNEDDQRIGEFEVGLQFFMTPSAVKLEMAADGTKLTNTGTPTTAPSITSSSVSYKSVKTSDKSDNRMYGFGANLGWNGLQSKIGTNGVLLGSIGGVVSYSWLNNSGVAAPATQDLVAYGVKLERFILGARASVAPLFCTGKDIKVGPYVAGVLGGAQTQVTLDGIQLSGSPLSIISGLQQGTTGILTSGAWTNVDTTAVGYAGTATPISSTKFGKVFTTDSDAWKFYCAGEVGVRFQMRNVGLQLGALFDNNEYKIPSFQEKSKTVTLGQTSGERTTVTTFYAPSATVASSVTGTKVTQAVTLNNLMFKKEGSSMNAFLTASVVLDM